MLHADLTGTSERHGMQRLWFDKHALYKIHNCFADVCYASGSTSDGSAGTADPGKALQEAMAREALLVKKIEQLSKRLAAYKEENTQLEDLLHQADKQASGEHSTLFCTNKVMSLCMFSKCVIR